MTMIAHLQVLERLYLKVEYQSFKKTTLKNLNVSLINFMFYTCFLIWQIGPIWMHIQNQWLYAQNIQKNRLKSN